MSVPVTVALSPAGTVNISGQLQMTAKAVEAITLAASTSQQLLPLPTGLSSAAFVAISSLSMTDLTVKLSTVSGSTSISVPAGTTLILYSVTTLYVSSTIGGELQLVIG